MANNPSHDISIHLPHEQVRIIQRELLKVYEAKREITKYSFKMEAKEIEDFWRQEMPEEIRAALPSQFRDLKSPGLYVEGHSTDNFRKFAVGESSSMKPEKLYACLAWLSWAENEFSSLTIADIAPGLKATQSKIIRLLDEHLFQNSDHEPMITHRHFAPEYEVATNDTGSWICVGSSISEHVLEIRLYEAHSEEILVFNGQLVLGPEDAGYVFMKEMSTGESKMFCFIPQGNDVLQGRKIERFSLVEISSGRGSFRDDIDLPITNYVRAAP